MGHMEGHPSAGVSFDSKILRRARIMKGGLVWSLLGSGLCSLEPFHPSALKEWEAHFQVLFSPSHTSPCSFPTYKKPETFGLANRNIRLR